MANPPFNLDLVDAERIVRTGDVDVMMSIRSNFFHTRSVPCELWFFERGKAEATLDSFRTKIDTDVRQPILTAASELVDADAAYRSDQASLAKDLAKLIQPKLTVTRPETGL
jgi:hypothetical protein